MASGVASVWVPVDDMDRARAFYRDTLGLTEQKSTEDWSEFDANGLMIGLNAREVGLNAMVQRLKRHAAAARQAA